MNMSHTVVPIAATFLVAIAGMVILFGMDFGNNDVQRGPVTMITAATVEQAGATTVPTEQSTQP